MESPEYPALQEFAEWYWGIHGYVATVVCTFGVVANLANIIVLTRRSMITSTNIILTWLAVADLLTMACFLPFGGYFYIARGYIPEVPFPATQSVNWIRYFVFYINFSVVCHTVAVWLTITLAIFRYLCICYPTKGTSLCSQHRAKIAVFVVYLTSAVICLPNYLVIAIAPKIHPDPSELSSSVDNNVTSSQPLEDYDEITTTAGTDFDSPPNGSLAYYTVADEPGNLRVFNFWIQALFIKLVPCFLLTALTIMLIVAMHEANVRRMKLKSQGRRDESERAREHNRTTAMLLAVVGLFQLVELPHGVLTLCSIFLPDFHNKVYTALGDVIDIMALLNNSINFVLYCTMSRQFRDQFVETFFCSGAMAVLQSSSGPSTQQRSVSGSTTATAGSSSGWTRLKAIPCSVFKSPNRPLPLPPTTTNAADRAKTGSCNGGDCAVDPPNCWASNC